MLCVFFLYLCTRESVEIMLQFQILGVVSDSKMNIVGKLGGHFLNFPIVFKSAGKKQKKKLRKNGNFYAKPVFDQIDFFIWL
ncbi:Uncharacterized protein FWK35_00038610 [Aphis craccivora]|uniref:Uncharacterized protein n=1 Tax=Aphis craccivora TaxID=307492 RepID=A0A6G0VL94_APHCR|nr:Uncharacterized protein FWK35_00038610 [Aphis craccivora]